MSPPAPGLRSPMAASAVVFLAILLLPGTAAAAVSCSVSVTTATVTMGSGDTANLAVSGASITVNGTPCGTTSTVDTIVVNGVGGNEVVNVSLAGGPFAPGATPEPTGVSEIEISASLRGGSDSLVITGGAGVDTVALGSLGINLTGDDDADLTFTGVEGFVVNGAEGNDVVTGRGDDDVGVPFTTGIFMLGGDGDDDLTGGAGTDGILGGAGMDTVRGWTGNDVMFGEADDDALDGGAGDDNLFGGTGSDAALYASATSAVTVNLATASASGGGVGNDTLTSLENVTGSDFGDTLTGDDTANVLNGAGGVDVLRGAGGADALLGGDGLDTAAYDSEGAGVMVDLQTGATGGAAAGDTLSGVENLTGSDFADSLTGDAGTNDLQGGSGADTLAGGGGDDVIAGGAGADVLDEGAVPNGSDDLSGGTGVDTIVYGDRVTDIALSLNGNFDDGAAAEGDNANEDLETMVTGTGDDVLVGNDAGQRMESGPGDDFIIGGDGDDTLVAGPGTDTADYQGATGGVRVDLATGKALGGAGNDILEGVEDLIGSFGSDILKGNLGPNEILGGAGDDEVAGGGGRDRLSGGSGDDELRGKKGNDVLLGKAGNDLLLGGADKDRMDGGPGVDSCKGGPGPDRARRCEERSPSPARSRERAGSS
ncbi:MAG: calcium-binding protein [Actinomycetota bacterium]